FFSSRRRHTRSKRDWSSDVCSSDLECLDPDDDGPQGRYEVDRSYWLDDIPKDRNTDIVNTLHQHWKNNNYRILSDKRASDDKFRSEERRVGKECRERWEQEK